jgi:hypothetical protein
MKKQLLTLASLISLAINTQAQSNFGPAVNYGAGTNPQSVTTADFNNDGKTDLAVANRGASNISVLLGSGTGSFAAAVNYTVGSSPYSVTSADFNGDNKTDLVVACLSGSVSVLLGSGTGTFAPAINYSVALGLVSVTTADFNGDGKTDLALAFQSGPNGKVAILLGTGTGSFGTAVNYSTGSGASSLSTADFNGDGKTDLVAANYSGGDVSILLGTGIGTFSVAVNYVSGSAPISVITTDFNSDGKTDLAVANDCGNCGASILLGLGSGTFTTAVNYTAGNTSRSITSGDFNGDGKIDLGVANASGTVSILFGDGIGMFAPAVNYAAGSALTSISTADFNGDGKFDLVVCNYNTSNVSILLNTTPPANFSTPSLNCPFRAITFSNSSSPVYTSWAWVFPGGNPSISVLQNPIITYSASGTYSAVLTTSNSVGTSGGNIQTFFVTSSPTVTAVSSNSLLCAGQTATLTASGANTYSWSPYPGGMFSSSGSSMFTVPPVGTVIYTITGTNTLTGCTNQTTLTQSSQNCTGIENLTQYNNLINVYPNPTKGLITIELNTNSKVYITNALGQEVYNEALSSGKHDIDIQYQSNGVYFMKVLQQDKQQTIKLIKE